MKIAKSKTSKGFKAFKVFKETLKKQEKQVGEIYSPFKHGITQSMLSSWLNCRKQCRISLQRYRLKKPNAAFLFGSFIHYLHEMYVIDLGKGVFDVGNNENLYNKAVTWTSKHVIKFPTVYPECKNFTNDALQEMYTRAGTLFVHYILHYTKTYRNMNWIGVESQFNVPLNVGLEKPIIMRGMKDGEFKHKGKFWLFETKTKSRINEQALVSLLKDDFQTQYYSVAYMQETGQYPEGCLYNILRKPGLHKSVKDSSKSFAKRLHEDISERPHYYFLQYEMKLSRRELQIFYNEVSALIREYVKWWKDMDNLTYANRDYCENKYGSCQFLPLCMDDNYEIYTQIPVFFPELETA